MDLFYTNKKETFEVNLGHGRFYLSFSFPGSHLCLWLYRKPFWYVEYKTTRWIFDNKVCFSFLFFAFEWLDWMKGTESSKIVRKGFKLDWKGVEKWTSEEPT